MFWKLSWHARYASPDVVVQNRQLLEEMPSGAPTANLTGEVLNGRFRC